ncbi:GntR family transcriptional regulator [Rhodoplanes sp. TEM]|uniref:GntR family transcriptional regulator n=1 Tax=Rhodoplanes tepidamans TaxID=200616 RepID=A0ABT5J9S7_RHOTP|nr:MULTISPECIES: GntR family transcriptional regulator [Rhodoplanes]MDC7786415.1 GntR family transcriptional regulator [Rhodoplanes tepidamans]MDC7985743.1 GntR family transcriptional regulator [Rhodoplanes sp. TEM]MDQ0357300.1 DNA-binding GntR family transcriptional regulator [Rhodoplanes tepidamans]
METRYAYVARAITAAIADGRHPVGSFLPNEIDLAKQFAVSRSTVRAAMQELQNSGLVSRRKSAGTRVEALPAATRAGTFSHTLGSIEAVQQFGVETERRIQAVGEIVADDDLAARLGCRPGQRWLRISFVRLVPGDATQTPICWTDVYIHASFSAAVQARMEGHVAIFGTLLESISGRSISEIRQTITAVGIPDDLAPVLRAAPQSHALAIRRQYILSPGMLAEVSLSIHPADRYSYQSSMKRLDANPRQPVAGA